MNVRRLVRRNSFDDYLSPSAVPRGPLGGFLHFNEQSPTFEEQLDRSHEVTKEYGGKPELGKRLLQEKYQGDGSFSKGEYRED